MWIWVLGEVREKDEYGSARSVKLLHHSLLRDEVYDKLAEVPDGAHVATLFMGPPFPEGYAAAFYALPRQRR